MINSQNLLKKYKLSKESVKTHMQEKIQASKGEFLKEIIKEDAFTIKSLTDSELIIADNSGQVLVFKKCK